MDLLGYNALKSILFVKTYKKNGVQCRVLPF